MFSLSDLLDAAKDFSVQALPVLIAVFIKP
jgi:hypothetical protein